MRRFFGVDFRPLLFLFLMSGCAALFGWDIHAPGMLSNNFTMMMKPLPQRIALYLDPQIYHYESTKKGSWSADPMRFHVGEAFAPMMVEGFQNGFGEFIMMEAEPTPEIMHHYAIPYLAVVRIKEFGNIVTWKGQALSITTETAVLDPNLKLVERFESTGSSDAQKVFAKNGGPEVNLNAAVENNVMAVVSHIQDAIQTGAWKQS